MAKVLKKHRSESDEEEEAPTRKRHSEPDVSLKGAQRLAKEMQLNVGFNPPLNYRETDLETLVDDIQKNAEDLDVQDDFENVSREGKETLRKLNAGPWLEEEPDEEAGDGDDEEVPEPDEEEEEEPAASEDAEGTEEDEEEEEEPVEEDDDEPKGKKPRGKERTQMKKTSHKVEQKSSSIKGKSDTKTNKSKPGIIKTIVKLIKEEGPISKEKIVSKLKKQFPDHNAEGMAKTVAVQVPGRLTQSGLRLVNVEGKGWKIKK